MNLLSNERNDIYKTKNLLIDIQPNIKRKLIVTDNYSIGNIKSNRINITNNGNDKTHYKILMSPTNELEENIRIALNDSLMRNLTSLKKENNSYIIYDSDIDAKYTHIYHLKIWLIDNKYENKKFNYKLKVIED